MTILVDIDSTITNFGRVVLNKLNERDHRTYYYQDISSYNWFDYHFTDPWGILDCEGFWDDVTVYPAAVNAIESWVANGNQVYLVSASGFHNALGYKIRQTLKAFKTLTEANVIITRDKNMIKGDILIDDCIDNLEGFDGGKICYAQPWNTEWNYADGHGGLREDDWRMIQIIVNQLHDIYFKHP